MKKHTMDAKEGKWYFPTQGSFFNTCCGCGLEHKIEVMVFPIKDKSDKNSTMKVGMGIRFLRVK